MKTTGNTILITGGSAGIGFALAKSLSEQGNKIVIVGRDADRLAKAKLALPDVITIKADITREDDAVMLFNELARNHQELNIVINNAGKAFVHAFGQGHEVLSNATDEMLTNYLSIIRLNELFLPILKGQDEAAIVNVSSVVAYVPSLSLPTYSASKAALHAYTTALRLALSATNVKVFELFPPLVDTEFSKEIGGEKGIKPSVVADELIAGLEKDEFEIRVGDSAKIYELLVSSPEIALQVMNQPR